EEEGHTYAEAVGQQPQSREVDHDAGLVVSGSAAEEPIALAGRDEGVCLPVLLTSGRLNIVMGVEKNRRGSFGSGDRGDDRPGAVGAWRGDGGSGYGVRVFVEVRCEDGVQSCIRFCTVKC